MAEYLYFDSAEMVTVRKRVSAESIAKHKADYYTSVDCKVDWNTEYQNTLNNLDELTDWFWNSMDMVDIEIQTVENSEVRRDHHLDDRQESLNCY